MSATRPPSEPLEHPDLPSLERMLEVAGGLDVWSARELRVSEELPAWHVREAEAYLVLAMLETTPQAAGAQLERAIDSVRRLPGGAAQAAACRYLRTFLSNELQQRFDSLAVKPFSTLTRRSLIFGAGAAAAGMIAWLTIPRPTPPQASGVAPPLLTLLFPRNTPKGVGKTYYADDLLRYRRTVTTARRFVWLVTADPAQAAVRDFVERTDKGPPAVQLETERKFDARDGWEFFIIVVADEPILPRADEPRRRAVKLAWTDEELKQLQGCGADETAAAKLVAAILEAKFRERIEVFVSSVRRESTVR